jgi:peptidyl-tRNA hydrolase
MSGLVQQIIVNNKGSHHDVLRAVAEASVGAYANRYAHHQDLWDTWLGGPFTKTVRRCKSKAMFDKLYFEPLVGSHVKCGDAEAYAMVPTVFADLPAEMLKRTHVEGLERDRRPLKWDYGSTRAVIGVNPDVQMSTGKTAAQVAHGLFAAFLSDPTILDRPWGLTDDGHDWGYLEWMSDPDKSDHHDHYIRINDAGFTELEPGTLTVIVGLDE